MRKIGKITIFLALALLIAVAFVGMANGTTSKEAKNGILVDVVEENESETDDLTVITLIRDPQQIDGTAYAYVSYSPDSGNSDKASEKESNPENVGFLILALLTTIVIISCLVLIKFKSKETKIGRRAGLFLGLVLILIVFAGLPMNASAQFAGGDGSIGNPYQISTVEQLQDMNTDLTAHYILINNIDATATSDWNSGAGFAPVGTSDTVGYRFEGSFDGDGHTISDLYINRTTRFTGLFGFVHGGSIHDVALTNVNISGGWETGGLVGRHRTNSEMSNCSVTGSVRGTNEVGGLVGRNVIDNTISDCSAACTVNGNTQIGGLIGRNGNSTISGCSAACDVDGNNEVGGLVGRNLNSATISNSSATCDVSGNNQIGGLIGHNYNSATISNSSATTTVSGYYQVGGLVGYASNSVISDTSATGDVSGNSWVAGLVGSIGANVMVSNSHATVNVDGQSSVGGFAGWCGDEYEVIRNQIINCSASGSVSGGNWTGGMFGTLYYSDASDIHVYCSVDGQEQVGGFAGRNQESSISDSYAEGDINGTNWVGGLVGSNPTSTISDSHATGDVTGEKTVGGLTGYHGDGTISNSYAEGNVIGTTWVGGLVGVNNPGTISNCNATGTVSGHEYIGGLVGTNYMSTISDSHASGNVSGAEMVGGLAGNSSNFSIVTGCFASGNVSASVSGSTEQVERFGGLIGTMSGQSILEDSYATGNVTAESDPNDPEFAILVGGLCGYTGWNLAVNGPYGEITNCFATGNVVGGEYVGGLAGQIGRRTAISNCYAIGSASGTWNVGGLSGDTTGLSTISNSYAIGDVSGTRDLGGLTGRLENDSQLNNCYSTSNVTATYLEFGGTEEPSNVGGLVGECSFEEGWGGNAISYCYSAGHISVTYSVEQPPLTVGGLVGVKDTETTISNSYWDTETSGQSTSAGGTGKTTVEMKQQATFVGWDFVNIWRIQEDTTYPYFWWHTPEQATQDLILIVKALNLPDGIENSLVSKLENAIKSMLNDRPSASGQLGAFINEVNAQRGVTLTDAEADMLIGYAQWIIDHI